MSDNISESSKMELLDIQKRDLDKVLGRMKKVWAEFEVEAKKHVSHSVPNTSNVFGLLGERGSGKSALLNRFKTFVEKEKQPFVVLSPLDCSALPPQIPFTLAVFLKIIEFFEETNPGKKELSEALNELTGRILAVSVQSQQLTLELSGSNKEYSSTVIDHMKERLKFQKDFHDVLDRIAQVPPFDTKVITVLLDDFDLTTSGNAYNDRLQSLLDELHQFRIFFLVAADFYRLERLSLSRERIIDEKTGRALVYKLLPASNRVFLSPWKIDSTLDEKIENDKSKEIIENNLKTVMNSLPKELKGQEPLIRALLPESPRGLLDLIKTENTQVNQNGQTRPLNHLLATLASCRDEPVFSRDLLELHSQDWVNLFMFSEASCGLGEWINLVQRSIQRTKKANKSSSKAQILSPISHLFPINSHPGQNYSGEVFRDMVPESKENVDASAFPLRDYRIEYSVTKDANYKQATLWVELLLNLGFSPDSQPNGSLWEINRLHFFSDWQPLKERLEKCYLQQRYSIFDYQEYLHDGYYLPLNPSFFWVSVAPDIGNDGAREVARQAHDQTMHFGWWPLLTLLKGDDSKALDLNIGQDSFGPVFSGEANAATLGVEIIPAEVWSMVLLVDGLVHCPWRAFSRALNWLPVTLVCLSAALVKAAYLFGLKTAGLGQNLDKAPFHLALLKVLEKGPNTVITVSLSKDRPLEKPFLAFQEDDMRAFLGHFFGEEVTFEGEDSLSVAGQRYLETQAYRNTAEFLLFLNHHDA